MGRKRYSDADVKPVFGRGSMREGLKRQ